MRPTDIILATALVLLAPSTVTAAESDHADPWCEARGGHTEVVLEDRTRVDCLTEHYAIEADYGRKAWSEGIGQALHYARLTGKQPAILVIADECRYLDRLRQSITYWRLPVQVFTTGQECGL